MKWLAYQSTGAGNLSLSYTPIHTSIGCKKQAESLFPITGRKTVELLQREVASGRFVTLGMDELGFLSIEFKQWMVGFAFSLVLGEVTRGLVPASDPILLLHSHLTDFKISI